MAAVVVAAAPGADVRAQDGEKNRVFQRKNLVAWCIVPFDAKKRTPAQRSAMMADLKIEKYAYDWRAEHLATFDEELSLLRQHKIELTAVWFPAELNRDARFLLEVIGKHRMRPQLWVTMQANDVAKAAAMVRPIAVEARKLECQVGLYNHGGWFGEPENQIAIIEALKRDGISNVGIVYNQHHGHEHVERFGELLEKMKPHLLCLNLNGMTKDGDKRGKKIMPIGQGDLDKSLLKTIADSGYSGPIGILNHTDEDAEARLLDNIEGLAWATGMGPEPKLRSYRPQGAN